MTDPQPQPAADSAQPTERRHSPMNEVAKARREHLRDHITDGRWHDGCRWCQRRRREGGSGVPLCGICQREAEVTAIVPMCGERPRYPLCHECLDGLSYLGYAEAVVPL